MNRRRLDWSGWCWCARALRKESRQQKTGRNYLGPVRDFRRLGAARAWSGLYTRYIGWLIDQSATQRDCAAAMTWPCSFSTQPITRRRPGSAPGAMFMERVSKKRFCSDFNSFLCPFHELWKTFLTRFRSTGEPSVPTGSVSTRASQAVQFCFLADAGIGLSSIDAPR